MNIVECVPIELPSLVKEKKCAVCFKTEARCKILPCSRCRSAFYCSATCQNADWNKHKKVCVDVSAISTAAGATASSSSASTSSKIALESSINNDKCYLLYNAAFDGHLETVRQLLQDTVQNID